MAQVVRAQGGQATADLTREHALIPWREPVAPFSRSGPSPMKGVLKRAFALGPISSDGTTSLWSRRRS
jgi:hypothetical protein